MPQSSMGGQGLFLPVEALRSPHQVPAFPSAFGMQMSSPMNQMSPMSQMNSGFQLQFQCSVPGTPASSMGCCTPASCTPGHTPFGSSSFGGNFFGIQNTNGVDGCTPVAMPEGGASLPPWPVESSVAFPPMTFGDVSTHMAGSMPLFQENTSGPCTPMAGGRNQINQLGGNVSSVPMTSVAASEQCSSPRRFGQGGCQGLSPGASPLRDDCQSPEQFASYPMPSATEGMQQPQLDFGNHYSDNSGPQRHPGQWCQSTSDAAQCMPYQAYQGGVNMHPSIMMMSGNQMNSGFMQGTCPQLN